MAGFFERVDPWVTAVLMAALMIVAWAVPAFARRRAGAAPSEPSSSKFEDAAMGLVGLLLAFTFAMALGKHDQRRTALVADSNAIGDFYTCATLQQEPVRSRLRAVIREYAELRLSASRTAHPGQSLSAALARFDAMHEQMTDLVAEALRAGTPIATPLVNTLNGVTSSQASRLAAVRDRLPAAIVMLLFLAAATSAALIGRHPGATGRSQVLGLASYVVLASLVVFITLDLNQPRRGLIQVSQEPLERLIATMGGP
jgi:hypothetical protein